jgi:membrane-associated phospholipid phosphatase
MSYSMVHAMITSVAIQIPAKAAFHRLRPNQEDHRSFPSGHSQDSFAAATVLSNHYGWKAALPAYAVASYVAASRLADRKHHLTDVVGGAAIGHIIGRTVSHRMTKGKPSRVSWSVMPMRGGAAASLSIALP